MSANPTTARHGLSTDELAAAIRGKPESIRVRLCREGSYYGIRPTKLPNGRLLWPADTLERLTKYGAASKAVQVGE